MLKLLCSYCWHYFVFDFTMHSKSSNIQIVTGTVPYGTINPYGCRTFIFFIISSKCPTFNTCMGTDCLLNCLNCAVGATMTTCSIHKITFQKTNICHYFYTYSYFSMMIQLQDFNLYTHTLAVYLYRSIQKC